VEEASGDTDGATRRLERAVAIFDTHDGVQELEASARFALAKQLAARGGDPARARALAGRAQADWQTSGDATPDQRKEVADWLVAHGE
jgi:hypothetical protein